MAKEAHSFKLSRWLTINVYNEEDRVLHGILWRR